MVGAERAVMGVSHIGIRNSGQCDHGGLVRDINYFESFGFCKSVNDFASGRRARGVTDDFRVVQITFTPGANNGGCSRVRSHIHHHQATCGNVGSQQISKSAVGVNCDVVGCLQSAVGECAHTGDDSGVDLCEVDNLQPTRCFVGNIRMLSECLNVTPR